MRSSVIACLCVVLYVNVCFGWGGEGHQLVAWIAEERLSDNARAQVVELLGEGVSITDAEVASWADQVRRQRRASAPWHYVNIPITDDGYDPAKHGTDNIITAIERFAQVLADKSKPREERAEALKFLIHFIGDTHQPLHCADRNGDRGGNGCLAFFPG